MRKIAFLLLLVFILQSPLISEGTSDIPSITNVFKGSEFLLEEVNINGWVKLDEPCSDMNRLEKYGLAVFNDISDDAAGYNAAINEGVDQISIKGKNKDSNISVTVKTIHNEMLGKYETLIIADVTQHQDVMNITDIRESIYKCLYTYGLSPNVNIFVTKYIEGNVDVSHRKDILHRGLSLINAEEVEYMEDDNIISISGYSKHLPYSIKSGDRYININLSCRYSSYDDKTYFWLGTPVINGEY